MSRIIDMRSSVRELPTIVSGVRRGGIVQETNSGALILASAQDGNPRLYRSDDGGATWSLRQTMTVATQGVVMRGAYVDSRGHIYMGAGTTMCYWSSYGVAVSGKYLFGEVWKSSDDGLTWRKVCTGEAGAFWHFGEDSSGRVYVNEYSVLGTAGANGPTWPTDYGTIPDEYPAVNVWRSDASGETFSKWFSAPKQSGAGLHDGTRHIHAVYVDRADRVYATFGDFAADPNLQWGGLAGKVVRLDSGGSVVTDYGQFGNGSASFLDTSTGVVLVGKDNDPSGIDTIHPTIALSCQSCNLVREFGQRYGTYVFDLFRSADGVVFGNGVLSTRYSTMLFSLDEGRTWGLIDIGNLAPVTITHNAHGPSGDAFISGGTLHRMKLPAATELRWKRPWYAPAA